MMAEQTTPSTQRSRRSASPASSILVASLAGCGGSDVAPSAFCELPCVEAFFSAAKECAGVTADVSCLGSDCYANGARVYLVSGELRAEGGALCLKRWSTSTGTAWQTGEQQLRLDAEERTLLCPDGSRHPTTDPIQDRPSSCDPAGELRDCGGTPCAAIPPACPAEGCLCRESACAGDFFAAVRGCAGLTGAETCAYDKGSAVACYSNGARVEGDATERNLFSPDGTLCLTVRVGPETFPGRSYIGEHSSVLIVDDTGRVVTCPDHETMEDGCGSGARTNFDDSCDPSFILAPGGCCAPGTCD